MDFKNVSIVVMGGALALLAYNWVNLSAEAKAAKEVIETKDRALDLSLEALEVSADALAEITGERDRIFAEKDAEIKVLEGARQASQRREQAWHEERRNLRATLVEQQEIIASASDAELAAAIPPAVASIFPEYVDVVVEVTAPDTFETNLPGARSWQAALASTENLRAREAALVEANVEANNQVDLVSSQFQAQGEKLAAESERAQSAEDAFGDALVTIQDGKAAIEARDELIRIYEAERAFSWVPKISVSVTVGVDPATGKFGQVIGPSASWPVPKFW